MSERRKAFTLLETLATLFLVTLGVASVLALITYGVRLNAEAQADATAMPTALSVLRDAAPLGRTPDTGDGDGDGWRADGAAPAPGAAGGYVWTVEGELNGYWLRRIERSEPEDIIDARSREVAVAVDVFWGRDGRYLTTLKQRFVRREAGP